MRFRTHVPAACLLTLLAPCAPSFASPLESRNPATPFASTYEAIPFQRVVIRNATILTGTGAQLDRAGVSIGDGVIQSVGTFDEIPRDALIIEGAGKWVTPGLIDVHSHIGVYPAPAHEASENHINERSAPNTAQVRVEHSIWPQDPQFTLALAAGVTTQHILPGSTNLFGGQSVTVKSLPARTIRAMKFPNAPAGLKMTCGENAPRVYGELGRAPTSRMGSIAEFRKSWIEARDYLRRQQRHRDAVSDGRKSEPPRRNLQLETLAGVLSGDILVHIHCYRADDMATMLDIANEFGYRVTAFHHATEAYKIADLLAASGTCSATWADVYGFKHEAFDLVEENAIMVERAGACAVVHSDWPITIQRLNQEVAKIVAAGIQAGYETTRADAIRWITLNAAEMLGIAEQTGSLEVGKMADVVVWDGDPFSIYSRPEKVFLDGALVYDRLDERRQPVTDFDLGILDAEGERL